MENWHRLLWSYVRELLAHGLPLTFSTSLNRNLATMTARRDTAALLG